jgi:hypothetical protein
MAGWNAITGARGIVAAFLMSVLLQLGVVDVTSGLLLCAVTSAFGVVLFIRAGRARVEPASAADSGAAPAPASGLVPVSPASVARPAA